MACELSEKTWTLSVTTGHGQKPRECRVPTRYQARILDKITQAVVAWFKRRPQAELDQVEVVVVDMSKTFDSAVKAVVGEPVPVMDRFHVVKQAVEALDSVLRSVQKQLEPEGAKALWLPPEHGGGTKPMG